MSNGGLMGSPMVQQALANSQPPMSPSAQPSQEALQQFMQARMPFLNQQQPYPWMQAQRPMMPQQGMPQQGMPQQGMPQQGMPQQPPWMQPQFMGQGTPQAAPFQPGYQSPRYTPPPNMPFTMNPYRAQMPQIPPSPQMGLPTSAPAGTPAPSVSGQEWLANNIGSATQQQAGAQQQLQAAQQAAAQSYAAPPSPPAPAPVLNSDENVPFRFRRESDARGGLISLLNKRR
jgi:hypothetical protein